MENSKNTKKKKTEVRKSLDSFKVWMEVDGNAAPWLHLQDTPTAAWIEISVVFKKNQFHLRMQCLIFYPMLPTQKSKEKVCIDNIENVFHPSSQALTSSLFSVIVLFVLNLFLYLYSMTFWEVWTLEFRCRSGIGTTRHCGKVWKQAGPIRILICNHYLFVSLQPLFILHCWLLLRRGFLSHSFFFWTDIWTAPFFKTQVG